MARPTPPTAPPRRGCRRRLAVAAAATVAVGVGVYAAGELYKHRDYLPYFLEHTSPLAEVHETVVESHPDHDIVRVWLVNERSIATEAHLKVPHAGGPSHPVLITMGGLGTGRLPIDRVRDSRDWILVALDYPYHGSRDSMSNLEFLGVLPEARQAMLDSVPAGRMLLDYLWQRDDVDRERVVLVGGSLGALIAPALAAADDRITAVAILFGAADLGALIDANVDLPWPVRPAVAWAGSIIVSPLEPAKYIHRVAPRPLFLLNGTEDEAMPVRCSRLLHELAAEPKTIRWLPLGHVNIRDPEFHQHVLDTCMDWLRDIGYMSDDETMRLQADAP